MSAYRFCRTDDIALLVDAWNRCGVPHGAPALTVTSFKTDIRERDVWCSSCMVAFEAKDPVAVLIACKRPPSTMILRIAVHPDHVRKGHGRHLLDSLSAKLAILGPERVVAEVPESDPAAGALFRACGFRSTHTLADFVWGGGRRHPPASAQLAEPVGFDDLPEEALPAADAPRSWDRSLGTLRNRREQLHGLALASGDRLEASLLYSSEADGAAVWSLFHAAGFAGKAALAELVRELARREALPIRIPRVGEDEVSFALLAELGFSTTGARFQAVCSLPAAR